jgi:aspartokinase
MKKIADSVKKIISNDEIAQEALRLNILNMSAYADLIRDQVEEDTFKEVKKTSIVVAISRFYQTLIKQPPIKPQIRLADLNIKMPLSDITYEKNQANHQALTKLQHDLNKFTNSYITVTQGIMEFTLIISSEIKEQVLSYFPAEPKKIYDDLVGLTVSFPDKYLKVPNVIYTILSKLAVRRINLIEIVSTYTNLSLVIEKVDMEKVVQELQAFFK